MTLRVALLGLLVSTAATAQVALRPIPRPDVRLLDGPLARSQDLLQTYLHDVDPERLLRNFRVNAGIATDAAPIGGWEAPDCELRGHFVGHYLTACAQMFEATGDTALRDRAIAMVGALAECQAALGGSYLSAFPEMFFDRLEKGERVWAPWYTLHKVLQGLIDVHRRCGDDRALRVAVAFAAWIDARTSRLDDAAMQRTLDVEFGGMPDALAELYATTGEAKHLALAQRFRHRRVVDRLARGGDPLRDLHANTQVPKALGEARLYELTGDVANRRAAERFFDLVVRGRCYPTGGTSSYEYWRRPPQELAADLGPETAENCVTHNLRKLANRLFAETGDDRYADYAERALWNGILGTHHPEDAGSVMYYVPLVGGLFRHYSPKEHSFVCCSGTGIESFATLADGVWWEDGERLWLTQLVPSRVAWKAKGVAFELHTSFPDDPRATLRALTDVPDGVAVRVRMPAWARGAEDAAFVELPGGWKQGEERSVEWPMRLHLEPLPDAPDEVAVMSGPILLAARLGTDGMDAAMIDGRSGDAYRMATQGAALPVPVLAVDPGEDPTAFLVPARGGALRLRTNGVGVPNDVELVPFHRLHGERYAVFLRLGGRDFTPPAAPALPDGVLDRVDCGDPASRAAHEFQAYRWSEGELGGGRGYLRSRFWLRFDLRCGTEAPLAARLEFASEDAGTGYELQVDGVGVGRDVVPAGAAGEVVTVTHDLPVSETRGKREICVKLRALGPGETVEGGGMPAGATITGTTPRWVGVELRGSAR